MKRDTFFLLLAFGKSQIRNFKIGKSRLLLYFPYYVGILCFSFLLLHSSFTYGQSSRSGPWGNWHTVDCWPKITYRMRVASWDPVNSGHNYPTQWEVEFHNGYNVAITFRWGGYLTQSGKTEFDKLPKVSNDGNWIEPGKTYHTAKGINEHIPNFPSELWIFVDHAKFGYRFEGYARCGSTTN